MSKPWNEASGDSDTSRAEAFSDAIFAIVITLLVLELHPPPAPRGRLLHSLLQQWPTYLAYLASYFSIAVIWLNHKHAFIRIRSMNRGLHWANLGILFTTALLPFTTAVLSRTVQEGDLADSRTAVALYALSGALMCASWLVFFRYLGRHPQLLAPGVDPGFFDRESIRAWIGVALYSAAGVLGYLLSPSVSLAIFLALPVFYGITSHGLYELSTVLRRR